MAIRSFRKGTPLATGIRRPPPPWQKRPFPPPALPVRRGGLTKIFWGFLMDLYFEIERALSRHPEVQRLPVAIALAARLAEVHMIADSRVSAGYIRKDQKLIGKTLTEILDQACVESGVSK